MSSPDSCIMLPRSTLKSQSFLGSSSQYPANLFRDPSAPSLLPPASHKTALFRNRYNVIHQRLLRNESFQSSAVAAARAPSLRRTSSSVQPENAHKITP